MAVAKLSDVKNDLSRYVARVRRGERVLILVRGVPVAEIVPIEAGGSPADHDAELRDLERRGIIRRGKGGIEAEILKPGPRPHGGRPTSQLVIDDRRSGW
jgi:prevent-host-death family protein